MTTNVTGTPARSDPAAFLTTADDVAAPFRAPVAPAPMSAFVVPAIASVSPVEVSVMVAGTLVVP